MLICERHWGDCNQDRADGCETQIADPHYCPGDPRIDPFIAPNVVLMLEKEEGPGRMSSDSLERNLERHKLALERCYQEALPAAAGLQGELRYRLLVSPGGCVSAALLSSEITSKEVERCMSEFLNRTQVASVPEGGAAAFVYRFDFSYGSSPTGIAKPEKQQGSSASP
jgi:hypothetical protein